MAAAPNRCFSLGESATRALPMGYRSATGALPLPGRANAPQLGHFTLKKAGIDLPTVVGQPTKNRQTAPKAPPKRYSCATI